MPPAYCSGMTISEHLEFSVLTAPVAAVDRRALSQAWYSALYGNRAAAHKNAPEPHRVCDVPFAKRREAHSTGAHHAAPGASRTPAHGSEFSLRGLQIERRAPRSALARKIERTFLPPRSAVRKASFSIDGSQGRVQVLLQSRGSRIKLVAICPPKARNEVATALVQARYALAIRGIDLDAETRSSPVC